MSKDFKNALIAIIIIYSVVFMVIATDIYLRNENTEQGFGASITTILGTDTLKNSRPVINTNFAELNSQKLENSDFTGSTGITYVATGTISFDCSEVEGTGINCVGESITLDATGDWTGTFDGLQGTAYLDRANHTGTQGTSTITNFNTAVTGLFSSTATGLAYSAGVFSLSSGYGIPLTASTTEWATAYGWGDHSSQGYITGNETITLTGDISGSGATSITTTIGSGAVEESMIDFDSAPTTNYLTYYNGSKLDYIATTSLGIVNSGTQGQIAYYDANGQTISGTSTLTITGDHVIGIKTTDPTSILSSAGFLMHSQSGFKSDFVSVLSANGAIMPTFILARSEGTITSPTIVTNGDFLGGLIFQGYDGTDYETLAAQIYVRATGTPALNDIKGDIYLDATDGQIILKDNLFLGNNEIYGIGTTTATNAVITNLTVTNSSFGTINSGSWEASVIGTEFGGTGQDFSSSNGLILLTGGTASAVATSSLNIDLSDLNATASNGIQINGNNIEPDSDHTIPLTASTSQWSKIDLYGSCGWGLNLASSSPDYYATATGTVELIAMPASGNVSQIMCYTDKATSSFEVFGTFGTCYPGVNTITTINTPTVSTATPYSLSYYNNKEGSPDNTMFTIICNWD